MVRTISAFGLALIVFYPPTLGAAIFYKGSADFFAAQMHRCMERPHE